MESEQIDIQAVTKAEAIRAIIYLLEEMSAKDRASLTALDPIDMITGRMPEPANEVKHPYITHTHAKKMRGWESYERMTPEKWNDFFAGLASEDEPMLIDVFVMPRVHHYQTFGGIADQEEQKELAFTIAVREAPGGVSTKIVWCNPLLPGAQRRYIEFVERFIARVKEWNREREGERIGELWAGEIAVRPPITGDPLDDREEKIITLLLEGFARKAIALELMISENTVKKDLSALAGKLGLASASMRGIVIEAKKRGY